MEIRFLSLDTLMAIHAYQIQEFGGALGVRDPHLLQSALSVPESTFGGVYLHGTLSEMAAAYLFHIVMNHPFVDGNKRVGAASAAIFLEMNGAKLIAEPEALTDLVLSVAKGDRGKKEVAQFFADHVVPI